MEMIEVTVIDYGVGNLLSVSRALEHCGAKVTITSDPKLILTADRVILPGVGAFSDGMAALEAIGSVFAWACNCYLTKAKSLVPPLVYD